jgi:hypothetical protein
VEGVDVAEILRKAGGERELQQSARTRLDKNIKRRIQRLAYVGLRKGQKSPAAAPDGGVTE